MTRIAIVAGATGLVGNQLMHELCADEQYDQVVALVRREVSFPHPKCRTVITDWSPAQLEEKLSGMLQGADVYCALGTTIKKAKTKEQFRKVDYEYPVLLAKLAKQYGTDQLLVISSIGADRSSAVFYSRVKGELEQDLSALNLPALHLFRPSLLLGDREEFRFGEKAGEWIGRAISFMLVGKLRRVRPIRAQVVARAMKTAARRGAQGVQVYESDEMQRMALNI